MNQRSEDPPRNLEKYRQQHQLRLSYMPWLYARLKAEHRQWAQAWQDELQDYLQGMENIIIGKNCFIAPEARLFAEPGRTIFIGDNSYVAADVVIHGPVILGKNVSINHHAALDGGSKGIRIGDDSRLAPYCQFYAFNHGMAPDRTIKAQPTSSKGIVIGQDVWLGAQVGIVDGVTIGNHVVVGMNSVVTRDIEDFAIVAGNPAKIIGDRREKT